MILTATEILNRLDKDIVISPFNRKQLNPNSYNLRLDNELLVYEDSVLDYKKENKTKKILIPEEGLVLEPGKLYLGKTVEWTETHNLVPMLNGRSSTGRLGITSDVNAGLGDIGFKGYWTLEITCVLPVRIYPNMEITQIYYHKVLGDTKIQYQGKYQNSYDIIASKSYKDRFKGDNSEN